MGQNTHHQKNVDLNRKNLKKIIKCVHFLFKQGLAFCGNDQSFTSDNRGNFKELLSFMSNYDDDWQTDIKNNGTNYNGEESQNKIIS